MAQEMTGPGTGHGFLSSLAQRVKGGAGGSHVGKKGPLEGVYLTQLIPTLLILILSVITMLSCSIALGTVSLFNHVAGMALGIAAAVVVWRYDYRNLSNLTTALFVVSCVLLALPLVPGLGVEGDLGGLGWVHFGPFRFQPSEPAKLVIIALMASACAQYNGKIESFADYAKLCGTLLVPLLLILVTDLGTGLMIFFTGATIIICSGAPRGWIIATIALIVGVAALVIITSQIEGIPHILQEYQLARLTVFLDPEGTASEARPRGDGLRGRLQPSAGHDRNRLRRPSRQGLRQRLPGALRVSPRRPDRLHLRDLRRAVRIRGIGGPSRPVCLDDHRDGPARHEGGADVLEAHARRLRRPVDVPGP